MTDSAESCERKWPPLRRSCSQRQREGRKSVLRRREGRQRTASARRATVPVSATSFRCCTLASLGCGNPIAVADLNEGETVLDLGSGGGIDVISRPGGW